MVSLTKLRAEIRRGEDRHGERIKRRTSLSPCRCGALSGGSESVEFISLEFDIAAICGLIGSLSRSRFNKVQFVHDVIGMGSKLRHSAASNNSHASKILLISLV